MKRYLINSLFVLLPALFLNAQETFQPHPILDLNFSMGFPTGEFADQTDGIGYGFDCGLYFPIAKKASWIKVGPEFVFLGTGSNIQREVQQLEITLNGQVIDVINIPMRIETRNSVIGGHAVLRANAPLSGYVEPYLQGMIGFRRLATTVRIYDDSEDNFFNTGDDGEITNSTPLEDWVFSYGGGGGFQIKLGSQVFLNLGAMFLIGGEAEYYTRDDIRDFQFDFVGSGDAWNPNDPNLGEDDISLDALPSKSLTSIVQANLGITILFGMNGN